MRHGTVGTYNVHRCRCGPCCEAKADAARRHTVTGTTGDDRLKVSCWCEAHFVLVPRADVVAGRTGSCRLVGCGAD